MKTLLLAVTVLVGALLPNACAFASWHVNGNPICTEAGNQQNPQMVSDGAGGAILTWYDSRSLSSFDIYAQRVNASGTVLWTTDGVAICTATGAQKDPIIVSDGAGGAIIAWWDDRLGYDALYGQRVNASGVVQWTTNGIVLDSEPDPEWPIPISDQDIASDGAGGAIVTWMSYRSEYADIYAQRVNAAGAVQWTTKGVKLAATGGDGRYAPEITSDGAGGAIIVWEDGINGHNQIYAQRVNASGAVQWTADGVPLCTATGGQYSPMITSDGAGGVIVTWEDLRSGTFSDVYAQRVNASGAVQWTVDGVAICTATGGQISPTITSDGAGGAIVTWMSYQSEYADIYAQRVNAAGAVQWTANGVALCAATGDQDSPTIASDGASGAIVTWYDHRGGTYSDIYAQMVDSSGAVELTTDGVALCTAMGNQKYPQIVSDGARGAIVGWQDNRDDEWDVYAQHLYSTSCDNPSWPANGNAVSTALYGQRYPQLAPDGLGGAIMAWQDNRTTADWDIYAQRVDAYGCMLWEFNGSAICTSLHDQQNLEMIPDGVGGAIITWEDYRGNIAHANIYAQRVNASGYVVWTLEGIHVCSSRGSQFPRIVSDGAGGAIIAWEDLQLDTGYDVYVQRVNASGVVQWAADGVAACTASGDQGYIRMIPDGSGGAIITWQDNRSGTYGDIYAQRVDHDGNLLWDRSSVAVCTAAWAQNNPQIASDHAGGAIIAWQDRRRAPADWDIYAQRVNASGNVIWQADGIVVCDAEHDQSNLQMTSDGNGGAIVTWEDFGNGADYDIMMQRVGASGVLRWEPVAGVPICAAEHYQRYPQIASRGQGRAIIAWQDNRTLADWDLYAQQVDTTGSIAWPDDGAAFCSAVNDQAYQQLVPDGGDGAIVVWEDYRSGTNYDIYVGHIAPVSTTDVSDIGVTLSGLSQNYPNPFNPATLITFSVRVPGEVKLRIYDVAGRVLRTLVDGWRGTGAYREMWDGKRDDGTAVASGVYFYRLETSGLTATRKMVLMR